MAHPNIVSLRLNRRGREFEFKIIKGAIVLVIYEICACLNDRRFRSLFNEIDWREIDYKNNVFQNRVHQMMSDDSFSI